MKLYRLSFLDSNDSQCITHIKSESAKKAKVRLLGEWDVKKFYEVREV